MFTYCVLGLHGYFSEMDPACYSIGKKRRYSNQRRVEELEFGEADISDSLETTPSLSARFRRTRQGFVLSFDISGISSG